MKVFTQAVTDEAVLAVPRQDPVIEFQAFAWPGAIISNTGEDTVYVGGADVNDTGNGFPLAPDTAIEIGAVAADVYAVCDENDTSTLLIAVG